MIRPDAKTCAKEMQKYTNTSYDMFSELYKNTNFFKDLYDSLNPVYYVNFNNGMDGWQATDGTGVFINGTSTGGDIYKNGFLIDTDKHKQLSIIFSTVNVDTFIGDLELTFLDGRVITFTGMIIDNGNVTACNLNFEQNPDFHGVITGIRIILGSAVTDTFHFYKVLMTSPLVSVSSLTELDSKLITLTDEVATIPPQLNALDSRIVELEDHAVTVINPDTFDPSETHYEVEGISVTGTQKKIVYKDDTISLLNADGTSYLVYSLVDGSYIYKGKLVLVDGTEINGVSDIRALDGADGDYQEFRFIRSEVKPSIDPSDPNPAGFTLHPPEGTLPVYFTIAKKASDGSLKTNWSPPVKLTGESATASYIVTASLTSETYSASSNSDGTNPNLSGGGGEFILTRDGVKVDTGVTFSGGSTKNGLTLIMNSSTGLFSLSGTSSWTSDLEFFDLTATYDGQTYKKRYSVLKVKSGAAGEGGGGGGTSVITLTLYRATVRNATSVPLPKGPVNFNISTLQFSSESTDALNGWDVTISSSLPKKWITQVIVSTSNSVVQIQPSQWTAPWVLSIDGVDGTDAGSGTGLDGFNQATIYAYKAAETISLGDNPGDCVYTFATGAVSSMTNGWNTVMPTSTALPIWVTTGYAISRDSIDTINSNEWADPVKMSGNSVNSAQVFIYKRTDTNIPPTDKPTQSCSYNFNTGVLSGPNNGWAVVPPNGGGKYLWIRVAMANTTGITDNIEPSEWSESRLLASDGSDGTGGTGEAFPGAERKGGTYPNFNWNSSGSDSATIRWGNLAGRSPVNGDVFIQVDASSGGTQTRVYNGSEWVSPSAVYESLVAFGIISGDQILAGSVINSPIIRGGKMELVGNAASTHISITSNDPFGPHNLIEWFGPKVNGVTWDNTNNSPMYSGMSKGNAVTYKGADGSWYTSGSIIAGTRRTANQTTALTAAPEVESGLFGSDGGLITIKCGFSASRTSGLITGACTVPPHPHPSGTMYLEIFTSGAWSVVSTHAFNGTYECHDEGPEHIDMWSLYGSFTYTDPDRSTTNRLYRLRATHNLPLLPNGTLRLSIITEE